MITRIIRYIKNNIRYIVLIAIAFGLAAYSYGIRTAVLGSIMLSSIFGLIINSIMAYYYLLKRMNNRSQIIWNIVGILVFLIIILLLPDRLKRYSIVFSLIIIFALITYDLIVKRLIKKD